MPVKKSLLKREFSIGKVKLEQKALFAKHLSVMLKSGLPITESLSIAAESAQGKLKKVLEGVFTSVESGNSLSSSFARYPKVFSELFVSATEAGELSGTLEENLEGLAQQLQKEKELSEKIKGAMLYPIVVLSAAFLLGLAMAFFILPKITPLFEGLKMDLPFTTRALIAGSNFIQNHGTIFLISLFAFIAFMSWLLKQKFMHPITHKLFLKLPILRNLTKNTNIARFCRSLGTLLKSGLTIDEALDISKHTLGNHYYRNALEKVSTHVGTGTKLSVNLSGFDKLFPVMVTRMVRVGEESGKLEDTLLYLADFYEVEVETDTKSLSTVIEPILLIIIGLVVGFLALSIITPIYNITGGVTK